MEEIWKKIDGWEDYAVSSFGRVKRLTNKTCAKAEKILNLFNSKNGGYVYVSLCKAGVCKTKLVHRLVAVTFLNPVDGKNEVNHKDGNKSNPRLDNLEWCTSSENKLHSYALGLQTALGERNGKAKLTENQVIEIRKGEIPNINLARRFNVSETTIRDIKTRRSWKHVVEY